MQPMKRNCVGLPWSLEHRLSGYALAASAAGVGVVALAQPTEARIVYTPAHVECSNLLKRPWDGWLKAHPVC